MKRIVGIYGGLLLVILAVSWCFAGQAPIYPSPASASGPAGGDLTGTYPDPTIKASVALTTPNIGVATATSVNKVAITAPATAATLTIANNKTFAVNKSITLDGTDSTTITLPAVNSTLLATDGSAASLTGFPTLNQNTTGSAAKLSVSGQTGVLSVAGLTSTNRIMTVPDAPFTVARTDAANTFTGVQLMTSPSLLGTVSVADTTTPAISLASGMTNTGNVTINGKTSGSLKLTAADATAQTVTLTTAAQTVGAGTLTIPNLAGASKTLAYLESPSFTTPALGTVASGVISACTSTSMALTTPVIGGDTINATIQHLTVNAQSGAGYTLVLGDDYKLVTLSNAGAQALSIPTNASVAFPVGTQIAVLEIGAGQWTIQAANSGTTTVLSTGGTAAAPKLRAQYSSATLIKTATDTWYVVGDIN